MEAIRFGEIGDSEVIFISAASLGSRLTTDRLILFELKDILAFMQNNIMNLRRGRFLQKTGEQNPSSAEPKCAHSI